MSEDEVDKFLVTLNGKDAKSLKSYIKSTLLEDLELFSRILPDYKKRIQDLRNIPEVLPKLSQLQGFAEYLKDKGVMEIDMYSFNPPIQESMQETARRNEIVEAINKLNSILKSEPEKAVKELNRLYHNAYCGITKYHLSFIAEKISGKKLIDEGAIARSVKEYEKGNFDSLFKCLVPEIKNAISHTDVHVSRERPEVTFFDKKNNKKPLTMSIKDYSDICLDVFHLQIAIDVFSNELTIKFVEDVAEKSLAAKKIIDHLNKKGVKLVPAPKGKGVSIYKMGESLLNYEKEINDQNKNSKPSN